MTYDPSYRSYYMLLSHLSMLRDRTVWVQGGTLMNNPFTSINYKLYIYMYVYTTDIH